MDKNTKEVLDSLSDEDIMNYLFERNLIISRLTTILSHETIEISRYNVVDVAVVEGVETPIRQEVQHIIYPHHSFDEGADDSLCVLRVKRGEKNG